VETAANTGNGSIAPGVTPAFEVPNGTEAGMTRPKGSPNISIVPATSASAVGVRLNGKGHEFDSSSISVFPVTEVKLVSTISPAAGQAASPGSSSRGPRDLRQWLPQLLGPFMRRHCAALGLVVGLSGGDADVIVTMDDDVEARRSAPVR
ncbi:hypothetical protein Vafri_18048, partial [Volvox africanus]